MKNEFFSVVLIGLLGCLSVGAAELETARWQAAIDAAGRAGGGIVTIPAGRHLVGQLDLRSNVELHLEEGAVLNFRGTVPATSRHFEQSNNPNNRTIPSTK